MSTGDRTAYSNLTLVLLFWNCWRISAGEKGNTVTAVFQLVTQVSVGGFQAQAVGLSDDRLARDQLLDGLRSRLRHDHRKQLLAHGSVLGNLLLCESAGTLLNFDGGDVLAVHLGDNSPCRLAHQVGAQPAGNQRNHHGTVENKQDSAQNDLLDRTWGLQKSNHWLVTPEFWGRIVDYKLTGSFHSMGSVGGTKSGNSSKHIAARQQAGARNPPKKHVLKRINKTCYQAAQPFFVRRSTLFRTQQTHVLVLFIIISKGVL